MPNRYRCYPPSLRWQSTAAYCNFPAPSNGYAVNQWLLDGVVQTSAAGSPSFTLSNVITNHTLQVTFTAVTYYLTPIAGPNGGISPNTSQVINGGAMTFTASPNTGYTVNQWLLDGSAIQTGGTSCTLTGLSNGNHTLQATFKLLPNTFGTSLRWVGEC